MRLFLLFTLAAWGVWTYKLRLSRSYRPNDGPFVGGANIVILTFGEINSRLQGAIASALAQQPLDGIVAVDEREPHTRRNVTETTSTLRDLVTGGRKEVLRAPI